MGTTNFDAATVAALMRPQAFDHAVGDVELVETHISWVILAGDYAYKIKKPVVLDFLDFGSLDKREYCCREEVRLNRPSAPDIYIDVVPITMRGSQPVFGGDGEPVEYAVRMRRFDESLRLDRQLEHNLLTPADMRQLGENIAKRHASAAVVPASERERMLEQTRFYTWENFQHIVDIIEPADYDFLHQWTANELGRLDDAIRRRFDDGFFRDCHGDLHLGNLVRLAEGITTFDCIEFNPDLRNSDVFADVAFLVMDLVENDRHDLAAHFLNGYLEVTGDYEGLVMLDLYFVYLCLVGAKVASLRSRGREDDAEREADVEEARDYCDMARRQASKGPRMLVVMSGVSGSGKSWLSERLLGAMVAIRIRTDVERKRLFGIGAQESSRSGYGEGIYSTAADERIYGRLSELAVTILKAGHHVIVDAAFLQQQQREMALSAAQAAGFAAVIVRIETPVDVVRERIRERAEAGPDVSEAGPSVLERQLTDQEPLTDEETAGAIVVDTSTDIDIAGLAEELLARTRL